MRIKFIITLIALHMLLPSLHGQTYSKIVGDSEIVSFLNWHLSTQVKFSEERKRGPKMLYYRITNWDTANFKTYKQDSQRGYFREYLFYRNNQWLDTVFSASDRDFLFQQYVSQSDTVWHHKFKRARLLNSSEQIKADRYYYSIPLFSIDRKFVIIKEEYYCGTLCAHGAYKLFRKESDGVWEYLGSLYDWVS